MPTINVQHPRRAPQTIGLAREVPAGEAVSLAPGESVVLGSRVVTR